MALWLLALMVVVGLTAVWFAMRLMGFDRELSLADDDVVRREWRADNPGSVPDEILRAENGRAALVRTGADWGLIWVMGLDAASHMLRGARVATHRRGLEVALGDFAAPRIVLDLGPAERPVWQRAIEEAAG